MATTTLDLASRVQKWERKFFLSYVRDSGFMPYMSEGNESVIVSKYELTSGGKTINIPLIAELTGSGVTGSSTLVGNEEVLNNYNFPIEVDWRRNAVEIKKPELHWTEMDLLAAVRDRLNKWCKSRLREDIIAAFSSITGVAYGSATEAQKDAWLDNNIDRVLFGAEVANVSTTAPAGGATNDHSGSLANLDVTNDLITADRVSHLKEIARQSSPIITPMRHRDYGAQEFYVQFTGPRNFRQLKTDPDIVSANKEARPRNVGDNPIFQDGDLLWDGVIIREIPEFDVLAGVGAASADVEPVYMSGAQAIGVAWGQKPKSTKKNEDDYQFATGRGIEECLGVEKLVYNNKDHGVVTGFFAAPARA